jgi:hypothetical protein
MTSFYITIFTQIKLGEFIYIRNVIRIIVLFIRYIITVAYVLSAKGKLLSFRPAYDILNRFVCEQWSLLEYSLVQMHASVRK